MNEALATKLAAKHTLHDGPYVCSSGVVPEYLDAIGMILDNAEDWRAYFELRLADPGRWPLWPIAQGRSGALLLGLLGRGSLYNGSKQHGIRWANVGVGMPPALGDGKIRVALVDDCTFTGATLRELREAVAEHWPSWRIVKEIVAYPYQAL